MKYPGTSAGFLIDIVEPDPIQIWKCKEPKRTRAMLIIKSKASGCAVFAKQLK